MYMPNKFTNKRSVMNRRKHLRLHVTNAERELWRYLRNNQLGVTFRRQYSMGSYIIDFFCYELGLIIEIDGAIHGEVGNIEKDKKRDAWLRSEGYNIVRYTNEQVLENTEGVYMDLK